MRGIEILAELHIDLQIAKAALSRFDYNGKKRTKDTYLVDPLRQNLKQNSEGKLLEYCSLREKGGRYYVTYKVAHYQDKTWIYSDEYETEVQDLTAMEHIFQCLGLEKLVVVNNTKYVYETADYEIILEEVEGLGNFIEVKAKHDDETIPAETIKNNIFHFLTDLGLTIGPELNAGKPEMLLNKSKGEKNDKENI